MKFKLWNGDIKNIFKRLLPIALATTMVFSFVGCGSKNQDDQNNIEPNPPYTTPVDPSTQNPSTPSTPTNPDDKKDPTTPTDPDDNPTTPTDPDDKKDPDDQDPDTPPVVEEFSLAENKDKIFENVMPLIDIYKMMKISNSANIEKVYDIYINNHEQETTIGFVFSGLIASTSTPYFEYGTVTIPDNAGLTFEQISESPISYKNVRDLKFTQLYQFYITTANYLKYQDTIQTIQQKLFDNYDNALWLGWNGTNYPQYVGHQVVCFDGNTIHSMLININNDGRTLPFPEGAVNKYFVNGDYTVVNDKIEATLPTDTLLAQVQKELQEKEQQEI